MFRTDDCIGVFFGSRKAQRDFAFNESGSYFLSRGWIGDGNGSVFDEYDRMEKRYGPERAMNVLKKLLAHYTRLVHIIMPNAASLDADRDYARHAADKFGLNYVEVEGTVELIRRMIDGQWNGDRGNRTWSADHAGNDDAIVIRL